jgi:hypothetical protein
MQLASQLWVALSGGIGASYLLAYDGAPFSWTPIGASLYFYELIAIICQEKNTLYGK